MLIPSIQQTLKKKTSFKKNFRKKNNDNKHPRNPQIFSTLKLAEKKNCHKTMTLSHPRNNLSINEPEHPRNPQKE